MTGYPSDPSPAVDRPLEDRLDSWKEIAGYMRRDVTTVQRWEKREGMPVHRHVHDKMGSVYAFKSDLDAWARTRRQALVADSEPEPVSAPPGSRGFQRRVAIALGAVAVVTALIVWHLQRPEALPENPLADARFVPLTDFEGIEQAAAVSRDGRYVAFLSDRDGRMDVWVTPVGAGQFYNLTHGRVQELVNPSVRTLGFSPDGTLVTFWVRRSDGSQQSSIGVWAVPVLGGQPRPYLEGAAEMDWAGDGSRLVYHTPGPGDPMYVRDSGQASDARVIFSAPAGLHSHFPVWSPDQAFIYFVQGSLPDRMVAERRREIGIRVAIGATRASIVGLVTTQGLVVVSIGLAAGVAGALALNRLLASLLFGVGPADPSTLAAVACTIAVVAALTCGLPAWRASRVDPNVVLRSS